MADDSLIIGIGAESDDFQKEIDRIKGTTENLEGQLESVGKVAGIAFAGLVAAAGFAVHAFAESEKASKDLVQSLQNQGIASDALVAKYKKMADELSVLTGVDDDAIVAGEAVLQSFIGQTEITPELAANLVDLAEKTGSITSAAEILGKGINGNVKAFKQFGITIDENATKEERIAEITEKVNQKFGGLAASANQGLGSFRGLETAAGNFVEKIGERLAPTVTKIVEVLTAFFNRLNTNDALVDVIFYVGEFVAIGAGLITAVIGAGLAFIQLQKALQIAQVAMQALGLSTKALVGATGIGLLVILIAEIALNWNSIWPALVAVYNAFVNNISALSGALGKTLEGVLTFNPGKIKEGLDEAKAVIAKGYDEIKSAQAPKVAIEQDEAKLAAAKKANAEQVEDEKRKREAIDAEQELAVLSAERASAETIDLKKKEVELLKQIESDKFKDSRAELEAQLAVNRQLQDAQSVIDVERSKVLNEEILAQNDEFRKLDSTQQALFLEQNRAKLAESIQTERTAKDAFIKEQLNKQVAANNQFLAEQARYGTAYATINKALQSEEVGGAKKVTGELIGLQNSKNSELKAIGKAAAVTDITIKTAQSAMNVFEGFSKIPFVGIPLGIAAAGAVIAYGAEQIGNVLSAKDGGLVPGFDTGGDSVPSVLRAGELVVPNQNFNEVVGAVADRRSQDSVQSTSGVGAGGSSSVSVELAFSGDNAEKFLTAKRNESRALGTLREASA